MVAGAGKWPLTGQHSDIKPQDHPTVPDRQGAGRREEARELKV